MDHRYLEYRQLCDRVVAGESAANIEWPPAEGAEDGRDREIGLAMIRAISDELDRP